MALEVIIITEKAFLFILNLRSDSKVYEMDKISHTDKILLMWVWGYKWNQQDLQVSSWKCASLLKNKTTLYFLCLLNFWYLEHALEEYNLLCVVIRCWGVIFHIISEPGVDSLVSPRI